MKKRAEPSRRSLRAIPEVDFTTARRLPRGTYVEKARRSFAIALLDPKLFALFGSSEAVNAALRALVEATHAMRRSAKTRRGSKPAKRRAA
jgi:hypothetical protein